MCAPLALLKPNTYKPFSFITHIIPIPYTQYVLAVPYSLASCQVDEVQGSRWRWKKEEEEHEVSSKACMYQGKERNGKFSKIYVGKNKPAAEARLKK